MHVGVDEAGKGPVLGSMFVAAVRITPSVIPDGVADSKRLSADRRRELEATIRNRASAVTTVEIPVDRIDDPETDMNGLTAHAHGEAVDAILGADSEAVDATNTEEVEVYLDAADTSAIRFERRVASFLSTSVDLRAEHGADESVPVVSAASILAKVARDSHVEGLAETYGDVGSGYPGDQQTRDFLEEFVQTHRELPDCARASWQTSKDVLATLGQTSLGEF